MEVEMALARVVSFQGVTTERIAELRQQIEGGEQPEGLNATEMLLLHAPEDQSSLAIVFFDTEDDYRKGAEVLGGMPATDTPGSRTSVKKYTVAVRMTV
jgi:hypothetical protein